MNLSSDQIQRYARHLMLKEIGGPGQKKLLQAKIAIIGAGGLGSPAALYLAAAGVGSIRLIDDDEVSISNLQRQILFSTNDIAMPKVDIAKDRLIALNPDCNIIPVSTRLTTQNAADCIADAEIVLDGCDSFQTRFEVNAHCHTTGKVLISGAVGRWAGQVSVFKSGLTKDKPMADKLPCYRCFAPDMPETEETCAQVGVVGPLTGIVGARMAMETIKEITCAGTSMAGKLWIYDALSASERKVSLLRDPDCQHCMS